MSDGNLLEFLKKQRWFAAKSATPTSARIVDSVVVPWGGGRYALARAAVEFDGSDQMYQLAMASDASTYDALHHDILVKGLVDAMLKGASVTAGGLTWKAESLRDDSTPITNTKATLGSAEQSNTSIIVGDSAIIKLFRLLRPGIHPDVEVTRFLTTKAGFANTPRLLAEARFEKDGEVTVAATMQALVAGATDAWAYALERGRAYFGAPKAAEPENGFVEDARRLGTITRAMHEALASDDDDPAFAPEDVSHDDLDRWAQRTQQMIRDSLTLLERAIAKPEFPKGRLAEANALLRRREHYLTWINAIDDSLDEDVGMRIRVHGDYHLGQVLHTASNDFMIIDFEGEPSRPLEERREKTSALRDVAGMLRSFAYAAATLGNEFEKTLDLATRELRVARWERDVRAAFLEGYLGAPNTEDSSILPEQPAHVRQMISMFEAEKAFYELSYELNNRPAWVGIPMRGISKLFM